MQAGTSKSAFSKEREHWQPEEPISAKPFSAIQEWGANPRPSTWKPDRAIIVDWGSQ